jgi:hypothetical protein
LCGDGHDSAEAPTSLEEAAARCEAVLLPLEEAIAESRRKVEKAEKEAAAAVSIVQRLLQGCNDLLPSSSPRDGSSEDGEATVRGQRKTLKELQEMAVSVDAAMAEVRIELECSRKGSGTWGSRARSRSAGRRSQVERPGSKDSYDRSLGSRMSKSVGAEGAEADGQEPEELSISIRKSTGALSELMWDKERENTCNVCDAKIGKRVFKPRHHCRICLRCVCAACSPNSIMLDGEKQPVRVCTPCVAETPQIPMLTRRALDLGSKLQAIGEDLGGTAENHVKIVAPNVSNGLEQALNFCDVVLAPLEDLHEKAPLQAATQ